MRNAKKYEKKDGDVSDKKDKKTEKTTRKREKSAEPASKEKKRKEKKQKSQKRCVYNVYTSVWVGLLGAILSCDPLEPAGNTAFGLTPAGGQAHMRPLNPSVSDLPYLIGHVLHGNSSIGYI